MTLSLRPADWTEEEDRLGFFGPDSITWRVHSDPSFSVAGLRALLLQALHPVAMDGVAQNSEGFRESPWPRLMRTAAYVDTLTFGTRREALRAVRRVRGIHRQLGGVEETSGRDYRVDDPDLLLWVHCCEVDSLLSVARRAGVPLTDAAATGALRAFRQATLTLPQNARRSPIVWAGWERVASPEPRSA